MKVQSAVCLVVMFISFLTSAAEEKNVSDWIQDIKAGKVEVPQELNRIMQGAMLETTYRPMFKDKFSPEQKNDLEKYRAWKNSAGRTLIEKCLAGQPLPQNDQKYLQIVQASIMFDAWGNGGPDRKKGSTPAGQFVGEVVKKGETAMKKGFVQGQLSAEDIEDLRAYAVYTAMKLTGAKIVPHDFGIGNDRLAPGQDAPKINLPFLETILASADYSDILKQDDCAFLKPEGVLKLLEIISFYSNGRAKPRQDTGPGFSNLPSAKDGRPAVLVFGYAPDVFLKVCLPVYDVLSRAYQGKADFYYVDTNYHDTYASGPVFKGEQAGIENVRLTHPVNMEQRARMAKALYLTHPSVTVPCLLDNMGQTVRNAYHIDGGSAQFYIIDAEGKIACASPSSWYCWTNGNYSDTVLWANEIEIQLNKILRNNGKRDESLTVLPSKGIKYGMERPARKKAFAARKAKNYAYGAGLFVWFIGRIASIDSSGLEVVPEFGENSRMKGLGFIPSSTGDIKLGRTASANLEVLRLWLEMEKKGKNLKLKVDDNVEIFLNGEEAELSQLGKGDFVGVWFDPKKYSAGDELPKPIQIRACSLNNRDAKQ